MLLQSFDTPFTNNDLPQSSGFKANVIETDSKQKKRNTYVCETDYIPVCKPKDQNTGGCSHLIIFDDRIASYFWPVASVAHEHSPPLDLLHVLQLQRSELDHAAGCNLIDLRKKK